jgi:hypothetical protein
MLKNLGNQLGKRFDQIRQPEDLDSAIDVIEKVLRATSLNHPDYAS